MKSARASVGIVALALSSLTLSVHAAQVRYRLTLLDPSITSSTEVTELNNKGEMTGNDGTGRAFLWNGQLVDLGSLIDPQSPVSRASGLNDRSDVVGLYLDGQGVQHNYLLQRGEVTTIEVIAGRSATLSDINNRRQVVGEVSDAQFQPHLFVWRRGEAELLDPLPGDDLLTAAAINDHAVVAGTSASTSGPDSSRATIWQDGAAIAVAPHGTHAVDLNNRGQVLVMDDAGAAYVWEDGELTPLPLLAGSNGFTLVFDINKAGATVGLSSLPNGTSAATLWPHEGAPVDLNTRIDSDDPLRPFVRLAAAELINDRGQIIALGPDSRRPDGVFQYYLLDPVH